MKIEPFAMMKELNTNLIAIVELLFKTSQDVARLI